MLRPAFSFWSGPMFPSDHALTIPAFPSFVLRAFAWDNDPTWVFIPIPLPSQPPPDPQLYVTVSEGPSWLPSLYS